MIVGEGKFRYEVDAGFDQLPKGWQLGGDVPGVATDSQDRVYVFNRSEHPVIVFDRAGKFLGSWGEGIFARPHGITITSDDTVAATFTQERMDSLPWGGWAFTSPSTALSGSTSGCSRVLRSLRVVQGVFTAPAVERPERRAMEPFLRR